jgi:hypothetical protein
MNVLSAPRAVAATEYFLLRLPLTAVHRGLLEPRLGPDSPLLLRFERAVGKLDMAAGKVLADPALQRRGTALARKAQAAGLAHDLEEKAHRPADSAAAKLEREPREAAERRASARTEAERTAQAVEADRLARKAAAEREAAAKVATAEATARRATEAARNSGHAAAKADLSRIEQRATARATAPAEQLKHSSQAAKSAAGKRAEAEQLAKLAEAEKAKRKTR